MISPQLYDARTIDDLPWPSTLEGEFAKTYLIPLVKGKIQEYIPNASTRLEVVTINEHIIPITINEAEYDNCYLLSSYYFIAELQEKLREKGLFFRSIFSPFLKLCAAFLKKIKINQVVVINNWLLTTNTYPKLTNEEIEAVSNFLQKQYPKHFQMFRSLNTYREGETLNALKNAAFRLMPCRHIYLYDPQRKTQLSQSEKRKQTKDINRIKKYGYTVRTPTQLTILEKERLLDLYKQIYIGKYTKYSPVYTAKHVERFLTHPQMHIKLLEKGGVIYGVAGFLKKDGHILVPFFGYDTSISQEIGLYRMLSGIILDEVEKAHLISHQGSGAGQFKKWRGFVEVLEYVALYDKHLSFGRRLFGFLSAFFCNLVFRSAVKNNTRQTLIEPHSSSSELTVQEKSETSA